LALTANSGVYLPSWAGDGDAEANTKRARALQQRIFGSAPESESLEERLKALEAFALGRTHPDDQNLAPSVRLDRVESKMNGQRKETLPSEAGDNLNLPPINSNIFDPGNPFAAPTKILSGLAPKAIPQMQPGPSGVVDHAESALPGQLVDQIKVMAKNVMGASPDDMSPSDLISGLELFTFGKTQTGLLSDRFTRLQAARPGTTTTTTTTEPATAIASATATATSSVTTSATSSATTSATSAATATAAAGTDINSVPMVMPVLKNLPCNNFTLSSFGQGEDKTMLLRGGILSVGAGRTDNETRAHKTIVPSAAEELKTFKDAEAATQSGNYAKAAMLYQALAKRHPLDPRYFYGAGTAFEAMRDNFDAFPNLIIAWHHGSSDPVYNQTIDDLVEAMKAQIDPNWRKTYGFQASDPETILNAGARCFKAGLTNQSIQLFEYAAKTEPWYAPAAAYNLGAVAESRGNLKLALQYYHWADNQAQRLEQEVARVDPRYNVPYQVALNKSEQVVNRTLIGEAIDQVQSRMAMGDSTWHGWTQADVRQLPKFWASEVCPSCAINRNSTTY